MSRRVVLPEPRKPVIIVMGTGIFLFVSPPLLFFCLTVDFLSRPSLDGDTFYTGGAEALILIWKP